MKRWIKNRFGIILIVVVIFAALLIAPGCRTTLGGKDFIFLVGTQIRERPVEHAGETVQMPALDPDGNSFMVIVRISD
jgi:hypothetical protein